MTSQLNGSVLKAFKILDLFAAGKIELTAQETADALGINMITAHRFLHTLVHAGALRVTSRGRPVATDFGSTGAGHRGGLYGDRV